MEDYPNEVDDGHDHEMSAEDNLPDTGTDAVPVICLKCGLLSCEEIDENEINLKKNALTT